MIQKYYVRVFQYNAEAFELHLEMCNATFTRLSVDFGNSQGATCLYAIHMDSESALSLKLSFPLVGYLNFNKVMDRQISDHLTDAK